jgi:hypothetical protein
METRTDRQEFLIDTSKLPSKKQNKKAVSMYRQYTEENLLLHFLARKFRIITGVFAKP